MQIEVGFNEDSDVDVTYFEFQEINIVCTVGERLEGKNPNANSRGEGTAQTDLRKHPR